MAGFRQHVTVHLRFGRLFQCDFGTDTLNLFDGRVRGQRVLFGLADDRLVHHVAEQVGPAEDAAGGVDDFEVQQTIVIGCRRHQREHGNLAAVAGHHRAEIEILDGVGRAVGAGDCQRAAELRREQVLHAAHEVGEPADVRLELGVGVVDHGRIEADAGDDEEGVAVVVLRVVEQGETAHVHQAGAVGGGHGQRGVDIVHGNAHIAGKQVAGADGDDAQRMAGAGDGARHRAHRAVAADRDHHVGAVLQRLKRADPAVLVKLGVVEADAIEPLGLAEPLDMQPAGFGLRFGRIHDEGVLHLVVPALLQRLSQLAAALRAQSDDDDGDEHHHNGDCGDDQKHGEGRLRHGSYCYRWGGRLRPWCAVREHFLHATAPWGVIMVQSRLI